MSMITKCPSCGTTFRVMPQQLQAQHGMVRCGRCANVFDGFKTLATLRADAPLETAPAPREESSYQGAMTPPPGEAVRETAFEMPGDTPQSGSAAPSRPEEIAAHEPRPTPVAQTLAEPLPPRHSGGWAFGILALLITLAVQGAYINRSEIAANLPEARPYLNKLCELLRCTVALPQRPRQISIEASDMQATDPANPGLIALTATLRNNATIDLGYPALDVVLTDIKEHTIARRIFLPAEYLNNGKNPRAGIAPNAEVTVRLNLDTGDLGAAGFRLDRLVAPSQ